MEFRARRGVSEVIGVLLMLAVVVSLGVLIFAFANGSMNGLSENYATAMAGQSGAAAEKFKVMQGVFAFQGSLALDGSSASQVAGASTSIATTLTTSSSNDVVMAYVSAADTGSTSPPSVSGISGGGLTWTHRATAPAETYTTPEYLPITLTNCVGGGTLSIDGSATGIFSTTNTGTATLTTAGANDIIVVLVTNEDATNGVIRTVSSVAATGLTFSQRSATSLGTPSYQDAEVWWALAASPLSGVTITVTLSGSMDDGAIVAFGVNGANTSSPWDPNAALPATASGAAGTAPTVGGVSTSNTDDMLLAFQGNGNGAGVAATVETAGSGTTLIQNADNEGAVNAEDAAAEYQLVSSSQSGVSLAFGTATTANDAWMATGDAIQASGCPATPTPFQQMVTWNPSSYSAYEATDLGNVRFCADSGCNTPLYAWLESCSSACSTSGSTSASATAWVRLASSVPANGGTLTVYMVFEPTSTNFDGSYWGEAPQLSPTYGQYDNGASVFNAYFNGNTAASSFSVYTGYTLSQATGVAGPGGATINALEATGYNGGNAVFSYGTAMANTAMVVESSFSSPGSTTTGPYTGADTGEAGLVDSAAAGSVANAISVNMGYAASYFNQDYESGGAFTADQNQAGTATASWVYATLTYTGPAAGSWSGFVAPQLYSSTGGQAGTLANNPLSGASQLYLGQLSDTAAGYTLTVYYNYMRARAYPPDGSMPTVALGSPTSTTVTFDVEEWYAVAPSSLSSASVTATLSSSDTAATWVAAFGISGADTAAPFDPDAALPATASGAANVQTTVSTTDSPDMLLYACAAEAGGMASGFTSVASDVLSPYQNQFVGYESVSSAQSNLAVSCGGTGTYGAEIADAVIASPPGADLYVRNVGAVPVTLVSVYATDLRSGSMVSRASISVTVNVGAFAEIPSSALSFAPTRGDAYSFTVTSMRGNSAVYKEGAT